MIDEQTTPLTAGEITHRKEVASKMLEEWRAERPTNSHRSDVKDAKVVHYESELRYIATIDAITAKSDTLGAQCPSCSSRGMSKLEWERGKIAKALELLSQIERHCNFSNAAAEMLTAMRSVLESS